MRVDRYDLNIQNFKRIAKQYGYEIFTDSVPNIWGIRSCSGNIDEFDDLLCWFYGNEGDIKVWKCTTKASAKYLKNPINKAGTAIVPFGQHLDLWKVGLHAGKYKALVQARELGVHRDNNGDLVIDYDSSLDVGNHGINLHRAAQFKTEKNVGLYSAGCTTIQMYKDWEELITEVDKCTKNGVKLFSYTVIDEMQLDI